MIALLVRRAASAVPAVVALILAAVATTNLHGLSPPLNNIDDRDMPYAETGILLFEQAVGRIWSASGTPEGSQGLLSRANRVYAYISDPAARNYFLARTELYRGRIVLSTDRRSRARPYFERAMALAAESAGFRESADAYRVRAEAGYEWMLTRRFRAEAKMKSKVGAWTDRALELNPGNASALILKTRLTLRRSSVKEDVLLELAGTLEDLVPRKSLDDPSRFQAQIILADIYTELDQSDLAETWCRRAAEIYPLNAAVKDCP